MKLMSSNFESQGSIPKKFTCDGEDISPALTWSDVPEGTRSFAQIVDDPEAPDPANPRMTWVHWVLYNIPAGVNFLPEGVHADNLPKGTREGLNDWKKTGYGAHALRSGDTGIFTSFMHWMRSWPDLKQPAKAKLEKAMEGHVFFRAVLVGLYQRNN